MRATPVALATVMKCTNAALLVSLAAYFLLVPACIIAHDFSDPNLRRPGIPRAAWRLHRRLTPRYERWARQRLASNRAADLPISDISGTEWPLFGSVFYLWGTEALQAAWAADPSRSRRAPMDYARGAVEAATQLVIDPAQAAWVKRHWGDDYLRRENVFYRMLVIAALTAHARLTGDTTHAAMLREQVEGLAGELDASPHGLLDDYPGQCYPGDVLAAVTCIRRADAVLGTDHAAFVERAKRAFEVGRLDGRGLPPYSADARRGIVLRESRGCGNSYMCLFGAEVWPSLAAEWYALYERHFWQRRWTAVGFREFPKDMPRSDWSMDVDAGPVVAGHGISACAFGLGAARANGRLDHAYPLAAEMLVLSWPLADGTLLGPRVLSNAVDAPYLGEAGILFNLTRLPASGTPLAGAGRLPPFVFLALSLYGGLGLLLIAPTIVGLARWRRRCGRYTVPAARAQLVLWLILILTAVAVALAVSPLVGGLPLLSAQLLPRLRWRRGGGV